jgi:nucleotide-binding universal stress UspA family protein
MMFNKILVGVEISDLSQRVFNAAVSLAKATNAQLMLLHAIYPFEQTNTSPAAINAVSFSPAWYSEAANHSMGLWDKLEEAGMKFLTARTQEAIAAGVKAEFYQSFGEPGCLICQIAQQWQADLIIVGRHSQSGLPEFFLGSISNYVLHHAPCSVLTIQPETIHTLVTDRSKQAIAQ